MEEKKYMNPYLAGVLLGLLLIATIYITGRGLGASGAVKSFAVGVVETVSPEHAQNQIFYKEYSKTINGRVKSNTRLKLFISLMLGWFFNK